jgi:hypothetical protein
MNFLFELEDKKWFPNYLREMQVNYIGWLVEQFKIYAPIKNVLFEVLGSNKLTICDLASGNGGPIQYLVDSQQFSTKQFVLTDKFPNASATFPENVSYIKESFDVLTDEPIEADFYTIFNAFHHFNKEEKEKIIHQYKTKGIMIVEILEPTVFQFFKILITTTVGQLLLTPFITPFKWKQLFFTYLIPINIFTITWDGLVSVLKSTYLKKEVAGINAYLENEFEIKAFKTGPFWAKVNCIIIKENDEKLD